MTTILKFPKENDLLLFEANYSIRLNDSDFAEIEKGTLARVYKVSILDESYTDEVNSYLILLVPVKGKETFVRFDYLLHRQFVSIVPEGKLTEVLYSKR